MCGFWDKDNLNDWVNEEKIVPIIQMITARQIIQERGKSKWTYEIIRKEPWLASLKR